jgi:hypothetical protein
MPSVLTHPRWTGKLGSAIELYHGPIHCELESQTVVAEGEVWIDWLPSPRTFVSIRSGEDLLRTAIEVPDEIEVVLPGLGRGTVSLGGGPDAPGAVSDPAHSVTLTGSVVRFEVGSDEPVPEVRFLVINGPALLGSRLDTESGGFWAGRTVLQGGYWRYTIDQRQDMSTVEQKLKWSVPFGFTHLGKLERTDTARVSRLEASEALELLGYFLSFVRGASVAPVLPSGIDETGAIAWEDWGSLNHVVDPWRTTISWFDRTLTEHLPSLFSGLAVRWEDENDREVLRYATGFYAGANKPRPLQTGLTLAVSGLELMAWVYLVRDGTMLPEEFEDHGARPRSFRELLGMLQIDTQHVSRLLPILRASGRLGPEAIWDLRTRFTHPRMGTIEVDHDLLVEAWTLATWYYELVLLRWFGYTELYGSRLKPDRWQGDTHPVPWSTSSP